MGVEVGVGVGVGPPELGWALVEETAIANKVSNRKAGSRRFFMKWRQTDEKGRPPRRGRLINLLQYYTLG